MLLFHFVGEVKNEMRRRRPTHIYIYILYWFMFVLGARPLPMRVIIKHCHHLLNTHDLPLAYYSFNANAMLLIFHNAFLAQFVFKTFNLKHLIIEFSFSILCCICWDGDGTYICCSCACVCHFFRCVVAAFTHSQN